MTAGRERPLVTELEALGAEVTSVGLARIVPPVDRDALTTALDRLAAGEFAWLALTSSHGVDSLECAARVRSGSLAEVLAAGRAARPGSSRVAAVGPATAEALAAAGVEADLVPTQRSAGGLLAEWPAPPSGGDAGRAVLLAQGDLAESALAEGLSAHGWRPSGVVVYHNLPGPPLDPAVREELAGGEFDVVLLTSGSVAKRLFAQVLPRTAFVALGPRTAEAVAGLGIDVAATSTGPDTGALLAAVTAALKSGARVPRLTLEPA